ncbi:glycoside hydrolase family 2 TIM barrel-domain containing protein [Paenibacillus tepidiphilus]|uniref:glycoside hydrolase family 2 TIM barrel-domain containing protein n=1 Tax=Paenibacillus tepidiphilus TaxID=2608683 RepID=UPI001EF0BFAA|nr:glycoside hydrolase family 2 TIM barrel-domain containing protein [Paenibacillus tepidiphilus]
MPGGWEQNMRELVCLNGEWDFMPLYDQPQCRRLPEHIVYEARKVEVPSSWRRSYPQAGGRRFGIIPEHEYAPMDIYGYPREWDDAEAGVLHRIFHVPTSMSGQRVVLRLDGIMQKAVIFLDRQELAVWEDGYLPLRLDITSLVEPGREHHLHVLCANFDKVTIPSGQQKITGLMGSWFGNISRGIWQDVYLESYPMLSIEDITIRTSVRQGRLEVDALIGGKAIISNRGTLRAELKIRERGVQVDSGSRPGSGELISAVPLPADYGDGVVMSATAEAIEAADAPGVLRLCENVQDGAVFRAAFRLDWSDASLWAPDSPFLYEAELVLLEDGEMIDRRVEVFGFREIWCEGPRFILNGIPVNLRGDSWHFQGGAQQTEAYIRNWYRMCRTVGVNSIRLHAEPYPEEYVRIADEEGMLIVDETAIYGSGKSMQADHPAYIDNCLRHVQRLVRRDKNHPSVILWSVQNEMRWVDGRDGFKQHIPGFMDAVRSLDPTRPIIAEGDNRLLPKAYTEVESRHYNIDGIIDQWDRSVPLTFGEHGGWWYICPQNSSMYVGLGAYRGTDESALGLAQKERLFIEYARRQEVSGISTFNFAHYFMRAMPQEDVVQPPREPSLPGVKQRMVPAYSLTINNGLLPEEYPAYMPNPAFEVMAEAFKPATIIAAEYNRCFYDDAPVSRSFDVYNDTLRAQEVRVECVIRQGRRVIHEQSFAFWQEPAERKTISFEWTPRPAVEGQDRAVLTAALFHAGEQVHKLHAEYRLVSAELLCQPVTVERPAAYLGGDADYEMLRSFLPGCERIGQEELGKLPGRYLLVVGSRLDDPDGGLEAGLKAFAARGGQLLLLEQTGLSLGRLRLSRRSFFRAHGGDYSHPVLAGLGDEDLMFWHAELREEGPLPFIHAAFEKPVTGDFTLLLECSAGDFGDGGDLWSPLLEYRSGSGRFVACQLELMANLRQVPQACLLLRNLLAYAGGAGKAAAAERAPVAALVRPGGEAAAFLDALRLRYTALELPAPAVAAAPGEAAHADVPARGEAAQARVPALRDAARGGAPAPGTAPAQPGQDFGLLVAEACLLAAPGAADAARRHAEAGGRVLVLPAGEEQQAALARLLGRPVRVMPHETYHLAADYSAAAVRGVSPVDLFGFDKVFLSPREVVNHVLADHSLEVPEAAALCTSVEGTAWKDFFVNNYTAEYSRLALVELNRTKARPSGTFLAELKLGAGTVICSQLRTDPGSDKALRLYTRLLGNLGASFDDGLLDSVKGDAEWALEMAMALPCPPYVDYEAMKAYYMDPEFSLNNLGEGLYGWMQKKERRPESGTMRIADAGTAPWFVSCFVQVPGGGQGVPLQRRGRLRIQTDAEYEIVLNGERVPEPEQELLLRSGLNRLIAVLRGSGGDITFGLTFLHENGAYMKDLEYSLTLDEVEPK